jgi:hypothetical protein
VRTHTATKVTRCKRCDRVIHKGQKIIKAYDIGWFVHVGCMIEVPDVDVTADGLAAGFTVGITGSRTAVKPQTERLMRRWLGGVSADAFVTGACRGVDAVAGRCLVSEHPTAQHVVVVPDNRNAVREWWPSVESRRSIQVYEMEPGSSYRERNEIIVELADHLVGFVEHPEDDPRSVRSGTWQTIRLARAAGVRVTLMDLAHPTDWTHTPWPRRRRKADDALF